MTSNPDAGTEAEIRCGVPEALDLLRAGRMVVLVDDEHRENEGDVIVAAQFATPQAINFMITHARGWDCLAVDDAIADRLELSPQTPRNEAALGTNFTVTVDARHGIGTGISASDRARTIAVCLDDGSAAADLVRPGHIKPLRAAGGGVLVRAGHTEGSVDLARLAGLKPAAVICEILREDGEVARRDDLVAFCRRHGLRMVSIEDLIKHRRAAERLVERAVGVELPTAFGPFRLHAYRSAVDAEPHVALTLGLADQGDGPWPAVADPVLVRMHSECLTGDVFGSLLCDCGPQLHLALQLIAREGRGVLVYMRQEGRGIGLVNKLKAYRLQREQNLDTVEANKALGFAADLRHYGIGAQILHELGVRRIRLLTNNPKKVVGLDGHGLAIVDRVPIEVPSTDANRRYLLAKRDKLGHQLQDELLAVGHS